MLAPFFAALLLQSAYQQPGAVKKPAESSPPSGDTIGYWQQRVHYRIVARLDEAATRLHSRGELVYVNNSPDTLREMYFHQYLERLPAGLEVECRSTSVKAACDSRICAIRTTATSASRRRRPSMAHPCSSTIRERPTARSCTFVCRVRCRHTTRFALSFEWDARPSTVPRRQGRRGRTWDFAQWYPKVAVYDRAGWEPNPFVPAGELYGEYGTYDVTMVLPQDQIVVATGVPVWGDPGWERAKRGGEVRLAQNAYDSSPAPNVEVPRAIATVRFLAENVHHFAWCVSPDYRYEGGIYVRQLPRYALTRRGTPSRFTCCTSRATTRRGAAAARSIARLPRCDGSSRSGGRTRIRSSRTCIVSRAAAPSSR